MSDESASEGIELGKGFEVVVNGRRTRVPTDQVTFDQVVNMAYPDGGSGPQIAYTVTFYNGGGRREEGGLTEGDPPVKVKDGTVFNVTRTDRS